MPELDSVLQSKKKEEFLKAIALTGNITTSAEIADISRQTHYNWLQNDPDYPVLFEAAIEASVENLEKEARRRAEIGWDEPVWHKGRQCGVVRKFSDTLLIFLLKGAAPKKYKEGFVVDQSQHQHFHLTKLSDEQLIEQARARGINLPDSIRGRITAENKG